MLSTPFFFGGSMILIGMFDSPFVRRVAVTMKLYGMAFEHRDWSVGRDFDKIRQYNPLGRVPTLVLNDGEVLLESVLILDYLDECVGAERALIPASGAPRRRVLRCMAMAAGAAEKAALTIYERAFRPPEKRYEPWVARCLTQARGALDEMEHCYSGRSSGEWLLGERFTQADITAACVYTFLGATIGLMAQTPPTHPRLAALAERCEAMPEFAATRVEWFAPDSK